jgi:Flp pilus assembly protein TadD
VHHCSKIQQEDEREEEGYYLMDYVSDYLENEGYPILEEAWKLALQRLKSESDCVTLGFSADRRHRFDVEERAFRLGSAYQSVLCAQLLGNLLCRLQRLEEGVTAFREAIRLGPVHVSTYYFLGLALVTLKRYQEAVAPLSKAIRLQSEYASAHHNLGIALVALERCEEAVTALRVTIRLESENADAHCLLGRALTTLERWEEAVEPLHEAIKLELENADYLLGLAVEHQNNSQKSRETNLA